MLASVAPTSPTLCDGWDAHDLAVHLWALSHDPLSWAGMVPGLGGLGLRRASLLRDRWSYLDLVARLRAEHGGFRCMPFDGLEDHRHSLGELWMHTQDVARPNAIVQGLVDPPLAEALWRRVCRAATTLRRRLPPGLVIAVPDGRRHRVSAGGPGVLVIGEPGELMCWVYGRRDVADVDIVHSAP